MPTDVQYETLIAETCEKYGLPADSTDRKLDRFVAGRVKYRKTAEDFADFDIARFIQYAEEEFDDAWVYLVLASLLYPQLKLTTGRMLYLLAALESDLAEMRSRYSRSAAAPTGGGKAGADSARTADGATADRLDRCSMAVTDRTPEARWHTTADGKRYFGIEGREPINA